MRPNTSLRVVSILAFGLSCILPMMTGAALAQSEPAAKDPAPAAESAGDPATAPQSASKADAARAAAPSAATPADPLQEIVSPKAAEPDYYARRAAEVLKQDGAAANVKPHPLAVAYPEFNVVVCAAGCPNAKSEAIVSMVPKAAPKVETAGMMVTTSSGGGAEMPLAIIDCVAGCYDTPKMYMGRAMPEPETPAAQKLAADLGAPAPKAAVAGEWQTTVSEAADSAGPVPTPTEDAAAHKLQKRAGGSGEWMSKINHERAGDKSAAQAAAAPAVKGAPSKPAAPVAAQVAEAKPATASSQPATVAKPVAAAPQPASEAKPAAASSPANAAVKAVTAAPRATTEAKPAMTAPQVKPETNPAPAASQVSADAKPAAAMPAEAKPATSQAAVEAKPVPAAPQATADAKPSMSASQTTAEAKPATATPQATAEARATAAASQPAPEAKPATAPAGEQKVAALTPPPASATPAATAPKDQLAMIRSGDAAMDAAMSKARVSIPEFWSKLEKPGPGETDFALKVAIAEKEKVEYLWLTDIVKKGDKIVGTISNDPELVKTVKAGQRYEFTGERVADWLYRRNGKLVGNETMRPLLAKMPKKEAETYRAMYEKP